MPLESLSNEQINIHDLTLEQEKEPMPKWQEHYEELKKTNLYDEENSTWFSYGSDKSSSGNLETADQLLGLLLENSLSKKEASEIYQKLQKTELYDKEDDFWFTEKLSSGNIDRAKKPLVQILSLIFEHNLNQKEDLDKYKLLKTPEFRYYDKNDRWENIYKLEPEPAIELVDVWFLSLNDKQLASKKYNAIKNTFFDSEKMIWNNNHPGIFTQLLGVIAEAQFDKAGAKNIYDNLKSLSWYYEDDHWDDERFEHVPNRKNMRSTDLELLGILCEKELEESSIKHEATLPLPETRQY